MIAPEGVGEQEPEQAQLKPDKEGLCHAVGRILGEGYVLTQAEINEVAERHYGIRTSTMSSLFNTRLCLTVMQGLSVDLSRRDYKGKKMYVDASRQPIDGEFLRAQQRLDAKMKNASQKANVTKAAALEAS